MSQSSKELLQPAVGLQGSTLERELALHTAQISLRTLPVCALELLYAAELALRRGSSPFEDA